MTQKTNSILILLQGCGMCLLALLPLLSQFSSAHAAGPVQPPDVYRLVSVVSDEIEQLRWAMGSELNTQRAPDVEAVSPHEVFFQAMTLFEKADRLAFEHTLKYVDAPYTPTGVITPGDVYRVVEAARKRLRVVSESLGGEPRITAPKRDAARTPTDVFQAVVQANRQLNLMLERQFSPSDVFRQVTVAGSYAASVLDTFRNPVPPPATPKRVLGKRPVDVYRRLMKTYALIDQMGKKLNLKMLRLNAWTKNEEGVRPSDVFDIASLMVSELATIHKHRPGAVPPRKVQHFSGKIPSDVYQRVEVLNILLNELVVRNL